MPGRFFWFSVQGSGFGGGKIQNRTEGARKLLNRVTFLPVRWVTIGHERIVDEKLHTA